MYYPNISLKKMRSQIKNSQLSQELNWRNQKKNLIQNQKLNWSEIAQCLNVWLQINANWIRNLLKSEQDVTFEELLRKTVFKTIDLKDNFHIAYCVEKRINLEDLSLKKIF
jgi:hypothetical protein